MDAQLVDFWLLAFTSLFTMINPLGVIPVYISLTSTLDKQQAYSIARRGTITAFFILCGFALSGQFIFAFFAISVDSLRIVGGIIFFFIGFDMLQARFNRARLPEESEVEYASDVSITPLAIPIISGPGAIATIIVLTGDAPSSLAFAGLFAVLAAVLLITYGVLVGSERIMAVLGRNGNKVLMRIMGLIVMVIAVEFFFAGLTPKIREMLLLN